MNNKVFWWVLGIVGTVLGGLLSYLLVELLEFKEEWRIDEATEEQQMFDNAEQKQMTVQHSQEIPTIQMKLKMQSDSLFQVKILEEIKEIKSDVKTQDSLVRLNVYLTDKIEKSH